MNKRPPIITLQYGATDAETVRMYDPYYIITPDDDQIDSKPWSQSAKAAVKRLAHLTGQEEAAIFQGTQSQFSWRMIAEMLTAAADWIEQDPPTRQDDVAGYRRAAYEYLIGRQYDTARALLDQQIQDTPHQKAEDVSEVLSNWMAENWNLIPEVQP